MIRVYGSCTSWIPWVIIFPSATIINVIDIFNTLRPRQYGRHFPDDIFKCIFVSENVLIWIQISLKFVHRGPINNIPSLVQIIAWRRPGDKPLSEPIMIILLMHICVTRPQWVNSCMIMNSFKLMRGWERFNIRFILSLIISYSVPLLSRLS